MKPFIINTSLWVIISLFLLNLGCHTDTNTTQTAKRIAPNSQLQKQPNILWLVTEDMGPYIAAFRDSTIQTPNLSRLAKEGIIFPHLYSTSGACAPIPTRK